MNEIEEFLDKWIEKEIEDSSPMSNEEFQTGSGLFGYMGFLNNIILHSKY